MSDREFRRVQDAVAGSLAGRLVATATECGRQGWRESAIVDHLRRLARSFRSRPAEDQLRAGAATMAWAFALHLAVRLALPQYATSAFPWWWNAVLAVAALAVAAGAPVVVSAWPRSVAGRWWQWATQSDDAAVAQHRRL